MSINIVCHSPMKISHLSSSRCDLVTVSVKFPVGDSTNTYLSLDMWFYIKCVSPYDVITAGDGPVELNCYLVLE
jgi:hypothetical protein